MEYLWERVRLLLAIPFGVDSKSLFAVFQGRLEAFGEIPFSKPRSKSWPAFFSKAIHALATHKIALQRTHRVRFNAPKCSAMHFFLCVWGSNLRHMQRFFIDIDQEFGLMWDFLSMNGVLGLAVATVGCGARFIIMFVSVKADEVAWLDAFRDSLGMKAKLRVLGLDQRPGLTDAIHGEEGALGSTLSKDWR